MTRAALVLLLVFGSLAAAQERAAEPLRAREIQGGIERAVAYMQRHVSESGCLNSSQYPEGATCLAALASMAAGRHPSSDPVVRQMLDFLAKLRTDNTYVHGLRANVWEYALRQRPGDERLLELLEADRSWLMHARGDRAGWRYGSLSRDWDNSCTQYGVLGVWAAARAGLEPPQAFWDQLSAHFRGCQNQDGGWGYQQRRAGGSTPNMATAGLASLYLVFDYHYTREPFREDDPDRFTTGEAAEVLNAILRGQEWLAEAYKPWNEGYFLYGMERCGVASGERYLGGEDWFDRGARTILAAQQPDGSIPLGGHGGPMVTTGLATLFLVYGGAPLAFYKLDHCEGSDDDLNPRDLANLTRNLWPAYEHPVNWQRIGLDAGLDDLLEAPVLFLSGTKPVSLDDAAVAKLRDYVQAGGTILAEPSDHSADFTRSIELLLRKMFPAERYPDYGFVDLEPSQPLYADVGWRQRPRLRGASDGARVFFLLSQGYLAADWQAGLRDGDAVAFGRSLLQYVRGDRGLRARWSSTVPTSPPAASRDETFTVGRIDHGPDGEAARMSWRRYRPYLRHVQGVTLQERPIQLGESELEGVDLLHLTGRRTLALSSAERRALQAYLQGGGTLLVDAWCGAPEFASSARALLEDLIGELRPLGPDEPLALGDFPGGTLLSTGLRFTPAAFREVLAAGGDIDGQQLRVAELDGRPAVVFSELDLSAGLLDSEPPGSRGYAGPSARRIVANVVGTVLAR